MCDELCMECRNNPELSIRVKIMFILRRFHEEVDCSWMYDLRLEREEERSHWIVLIEKLCTQVNTKMISYIKLIMKKREGTFHDEHEDGFNITS